MFLVFFFRKMYFVHMFLDAIMLAKLTSSLAYILSTFKWCACSYFLPLRYKRMPNEVKFYELYILCKYYHSIFRYFLFLSNFSLNISLILCTFVGYASICSISAWVVSDLCIIINVVLCRFLFFSTGCTYFYKYGQQMEALTIFLCYYIHFIIIFSKSYL